MELNENGKLAVELAAKLLDQADSMVLQLRNFDRSQKTISLGFCAPAPLWTIPSIFSDIYPAMTISSEIKDNDILLRGLNDDIFQMIVLPYASWPLSFAINAAESPATPPPMPYLPYAC